MAVSIPVERLPLAGLLLSLLTTVALLSSTAGAPDHLLLGLAVAGMATLVVAVQATPVAPRAVSVRHRSAVCRATGVRASDPDRPGPVRPRAPNQA